MPIIVAALSAGSATRSRAARSQLTPMRPKKCIESIWLAFGQPTTVSEKGLLPHPQPRCLVPLSEVQRPRETDPNAEGLHGDGRNTTDLNAGVPAQVSI